MNDQSRNWLRNAPGEPVLKGVNWGGLKTLYIKEVRRFFKVQMQTVWAPAITTLLYLAIFTVALGRAGRNPEAARVLDRLTAVGAAQYVSPYDFSRAYEGLGR